MSSLKEQCRDSEWLLCCSDPHKEFIGKNVLIDLKQGGIAEEEALSEARKKLHGHRLKRPRPHLDDKVLTVPFN